MNHSIMTPLYTASVATTIRLLPRYLVVENVVFKNKVSAIDNFDDLWEGLTIVNNRPYVFLYLNLNTKITKDNMMETVVTKELFNLLYLGGDYEVLDPIRSSTVYV